MIDKLTIDDVPENLKSVAYAIGIDAFKSLLEGLVFIFLVKGV